MKLREGNKKNTPVALFPTLLLREFL
jgi:hypothetical protein